MNLNPNEKKVVGIFEKQCGGRAWLSRKWLENEFGCPDDSRDSKERRTLDRTLDRLISRRIIVRKGTSKVKTVYALSETADTSSKVGDFAVSSDPRGKATITIKVIPERIQRISDAKFEAEIQKLRDKPNKKHWEKTMLDKFDFERGVEKKRLERKNLTP
ncbi:MAG: hypothetical protein ACUVT7_09215 [Thermoplasmata archaeon]